MMMMIMLTPSEVVWTPSPYPSPPPPPRAPFRIHSRTGISPPRGFPVTFAAPPPGSKRQRIWVTWSYKASAAAFGITFHVLDASWFSPVTTIRGAF